MRAAILAVGTEISSGQITNRNAGWISQRLEDIGIETSVHLTVPDQRPFILNALEHCEAWGDLIFVTGGLGPTSDDFTRDVVADWAGQTLAWNESAWNAVEIRLNRLGVPIAESNRQQCFFPGGATPLANPIGTAQGFFLSVRGKSVWVLPGPPKEIAAIWRQNALLSDLAFAPDAPVLFKWQCLGLSESALGELVDKTIRGSRLKSGFRAHRPYIEVKIWCPRSELISLQPLIQNLEVAITPWIQSRGDEDLAADFAGALAAFCRLNKTAFVIQDQYTQGAFGARISPHLAQLPEISGEIRTGFRRLESPEQSSEALTLLIQEGLKDPQAFYVVTQFRGKESVTRFRSPYQKLHEPESRARASAYAAEKALGAFKISLTSSTTLV